MALASFNNQTKSFEEREASYILWEVLAVMVQQNGVSITVPYPWGENFFLGPLIQTKIFVQFVLVAR